MSACVWMGGVVEIALNTDVIKKKNNSKYVGDLNDWLNQMRMNI